ncbi:MAG: hypothetical protein OXH09_09360 [Gammaproteobacteria bacterium]|nr:hypothetical protein [Gammaproteobacteria bacterium]
MYEEFDTSDYTRLRRSLIRKPAKGSTVQREFLGKVRDTREFLQFMKARVAVQTGEPCVPLAEQMSEPEFVNPPSEPTERHIFDAWIDLSPRIACRSGFWGCVTLRHIEAGRIESSFLAADAGGSPAGIQRIDSALRATGEQAASKLDGCVRTVLRRLGGLPERGNRSVFVDCPLARAWWRERLVREVAADDEALARRVRSVVHPESQQYWEDLVTFVVSRNSVFGSTAVRNILIRTLARVLDADPLSPLRKATELKRLCRSVSSVQASIELSVVPEHDVSAIIGEMAKRVAST